MIEVIIDEHGIIELMDKDSLPLGEEAILVIAAVYRGKQTVGFVDVIGRGTEDPSKISKTDWCHGDQPAAIFAEMIWDKRRLLLQGDAYLHNPTHREDEQKLLLEGVVLI